MTAPGHPERLPGPDEVDAPVRRHDTFAVLRRARAAAERAERVVDRARAEHAARRDEPGDGQHRPSQGAGDRTMAKLRELLR